MSEFYKRHLADLKDFIKRFIAFSAIGCINTLIDLGVFWLCSSAAGLPSWLSQAAGYSSGVVCSFILNRNVTFRDHNRKTGLQIPLFLAINLFSLLISTLAMHWLTGGGMNEYLAKAIVTAATMLINFFGYKYLVFNSTKKGWDKDE